MAITGSQLKKRSALETVKSFQRPFFCSHPLVFLKDLRRGWKNSRFTPFPSNIGRSSASVLVPTIAATIDPADAPLTTRGSSFLSNKAFQPKPRTRQTKRKKENSDD